MIPLLIILPNWSGDKDAQTRLCKLMVGMEPHHTRGACEVMMVPRQDCPPNEEAESILREKFVVSRHQSNSPQMSYPGSTNGMFFSAYMHLSMGRYNHFETTLWLEADMVPTTPRWRDRLMAAWRMKQPKTLAMGHIFPVDPNYAAITNHLNGGALWAADILRHIPDICTCGGAWDWANRHKILPFSEHTPEIEYRHHARDVMSYDRSGASVIHGVKDESLLRLVAKDYGVNLDLQPATV